MSVVRDFFALQSGKPISNPALSVFRRAGFAIPHANATEAVQETVKKNGSKDDGDTTLYDWKRKDWHGTQYGDPIRIKKDKDSIEQFNKTHKTQPD